MLFNDPQHDIVQSNEIIALLKNPEVVSFLALHNNENPEKLALKYRNKVDFDLTKLTQILQLYRKASHKIPLWVEHRCALHSKSYEQCTHAEVAEFKARLFNGKSMLDLTSGLGVDDYYFAERFDSVTALEADRSTAEMAAYNHSIMGRPNIKVIDTDCTKFDLTNKYYDLIYVDPDRRPSGNSQVHGVEEYHPNIFEHYSLWLNHSQQLAIKLSPMVDLHVLESNLDHLKQITVISHRNEVKEVLALLEINAPYLGRTAVDIGATQTVMRSGKPEPNEPMVMNTSGAYSIVLEPGRAFIKAQLTQQIAHEYQLEAFSQHSLYLVSNDYVDGFPGRQFRVIERLNPGWKKIKKYLKANKISAINIAQRNYFEDVRSIRQKLGIAEGGNEFLLFTQDYNGNSICLRAQPILTSL